MARWKEATTPTGSSGTTPSIRVHCSMRSSKASPRTSAHARCADHIRSEIAVVLNTAGTSTWITMCSFARGAMDPSIPTSGGRFRLLSRRDVTHDRTSAVASLQRITQTRVANSGYGRLSLWSDRSCWAISARLPRTAGSSRTWRRLSSISTTVAPPICSTSILAWDVTLSLVFRSRSRR